MRSRTAAARSNSSASAACSISAGEFLLHDGRLAGQERLGLADQLAVIRRARYGPTQGAEQRLIWYSRHGRVRLANTVSAQERSRNTRCIAVTVWLTAQAEANGPQ